MATRSRIGMVNESNEFVSVYCHWDGYPENNGVILDKHYRDPEKIKKLIENGDISSLSAEVDPTGAHSFDSPQEGVTVFYHRDRGEGTDPSIQKNYSKEAMAKGNSGEEFIYLFENNEWYVAKPGSNFRLLSELI